MTAHPTAHYLRRAIRRLRLKDGDIILCSNSDLIEQLANTRIPNCPPCPILFCPKETEIRVMPKSHIPELIKALQKYL
jgi:hypothetical protein